MSVGGVTRFGTPLVSFFGVQEDGRWTLFDAGLPTYWDELARAGVRPDAVEAVVLTHAHGDHVGLAERLRQAGARVLVHEAEADLARTGSVFRHGERSLVPYLLRRPHAWRFLGHFRRTGGMKPNPVAEVETFADGAVLDVPGRPRVVHTGGHTPGHSVLAVDGAVFVGDLLATTNPLTGRSGPQVLPRALNRDTAAMFAALANVEDLTGTVYPVHGEPWPAGPADAVARARAAGVS